MWHFDAVQYRSPNTLDGRLLVVHRQGFVRIPAVVLASLRLLADFGGTLG